MSRSYRLAIQETVRHFVNWSPEPQLIDDLKGEGRWNNDWDATIELIRRHQSKSSLKQEIFPKKEVIKIFSDFYFGGDPEGEARNWTGFILNEPLLVDKNFFNEIGQKGFQYGFISGAEPPSARFVLEERLCLRDPPLIAMDDAPSKPDPSGLLNLAKEELNKPLGNGAPPIAYLGDTVADVLTINNAKIKIPNQIFLSIAVAPPHLHQANKKSERRDYEIELKKAGADIIISKTKDILNIDEQISRLSLNE